jgi:hypothetical protein
VPCASSVSGGCQTVPGNDGLSELYRHIQVLKGGQDLVLFLPPFHSIFLFLLLVFRGVLLVTVVVVLVGIGGGTQRGGATCECSISV